MFYLHARSFPSAIFMFSKSFKAEIVYTKAYNKYQMRRIQFCTMRKYVINNIYMGKSIIRICVNKKQSNYDIILKAVKVNTHTHTHTHTHTYIYNCFDPFILIIILNYLREICINICFDPFILIKILSYLREICIYLYVLIHLF